MMDDDQTLNPSFIDGFERAWQAGDPPNLGDFLPQASSSGFLGTLQELVIIDLEFRWKRTPNPESTSHQASRLIESYIQRFSMLGEEPILSRLIEEEYGIRHRYGDRPSPESFAKRFPEHTRLIKKLTKDYPDNAQAEDPRGKQPNRQSPEIEHYSLIKEIGEGGMGSVYLAQQVHPVRRKVAVKVIRSGLDSREVIARFEAERQALAMMDHQNIARVFDAGTTKQGQPFFAMEHVDGIPITDYCHAKRANISERLQLFSDVCSAVQHAHQKGILHRDLKPSNVLIAEEDGLPIAKVIDFGLAKAVDSDELLTDKTLQTHVGQVLGTLKYMSPEQAATHESDVDTRTDVYALGVILYELLTGETPLDESEMRDQGILTILELIRDHDPVRPSVKLSANSQASESISIERSTTFRALRQQLAGDLDWIVMKALEKERDRRYDSASSLADDVQRFLNDEPVTARPPSASYRLQKFARKNRIFVISGLAMLLLLVCGITGTSWQAVRATRAQRAAKVQQEIALSKAEEAESRRLSTETLLQMEGVLRNQRDHAKYFFDAQRSDARLSFELLIDAFELAGHSGKQVLAKDVLLQARQSLAEQPKIATPDSFHFDNARWQFLDSLAAGLSGVGESEQAIATARQSLQFRRGTKGLAALAKAYDAASDKDAANRIVGLIRRHHWDIDPNVEFATSDLTKTWSDFFAMPSSLPVESDFETFQLAFNRADERTQGTMAPIAEAYRKSRRFLEAKLIDEKVLARLVEMPRVVEQWESFGSNKSSQQLELEAQTKGIVDVLKASHRLWIDYMALGETDQAVALSGKMLDRLQILPWEELKPLRNVPDQWRYQPRYDHATSLLESGNVSQAIQEYRVLIQSLDEKESYAELELGSVDQILMFYLDEVPVENGSVSFRELACYGLTRALLTAGRLEEAASVYSVAGDTNTLMNAIVLAASGKPEAARTAYKTAMSDLDQLQEFGMGNERSLIQQLLQVQLWSNDTSGATESVDRLVELMADDFRQFGGYTKSSAEAFRPYVVEILAMRGQYEEALALAQSPIAASWDQSYWKVLLTYCRSNLGLADEDSLMEASRAHDDLHQRMPNIVAMRRWRVGRAAEWMGKICENLKHSAQAATWRQRVDQLEQERQQLSVGIR